MVSVNSVNSQFFQIGKTSLYDYLISMLTLIQRFICGNLKCNSREKMLNKTDKESDMIEKAGNTKGGSITVPLTSCLTGLD
jgi:hypothetical protein